MGYMTARLARLLRQRMMQYADQWPNLSAYQAKDFAGLCAWHGSVLVYDTDAKAIFFEEF